jgi:hypothetical protein
MTGPGRKRRDPLRRLLVVVLIAAAVWAAGCAPSSATRVGDQAIAHAFSAHASAVEVQGRGVVDRILADDAQGSRHQRFIVRLASGQTLLISHNIDIAPRLAPLHVGDVVTFRGEYIWNDQGGVVHWTHHDPSGEHEPGWLKRGDTVVQ